MNLLSSTILIVDDEPDMIWIYADTLRHAGYAVLTACEGEAALALARAYPPDLLVLDILLPKVSGLDLLPQFLALDPDLQVIILSVLDTADVAVTALQSGGCTYLTKATSLHTFVAAVTAACQTRQQRTYRRYGDLSVDLLARRALLDGDPVALTPYEWAVLDCLARASEGAAYTDLWAAVWSADGEMDLDLLQRTVSNLRQKVGAEHIETVRGWGYRLV